MTAFNNPNALSADISNVQLNLRPEDIAAIDERHSRLVAEYGDDPMTKEQAAAHEAGHVVVAHALGMRILGAYIAAKRGAWYGSTSFTTPGADQTTRALPVTMVPSLGLTQASIMIAGLCGERAYGVEHPASSLDEQFGARTICDALGAVLGRTADDLLASVTTMAMQSIAANRMQFDQVQARLMQRSSLSPNYARRIFGTSKRPVSVWIA